MTFDLGVMISSPILGLETTSHKMEVVEVFFQFSLREACITPKTLGFDTPGPISLLAL